MDLREAVKDESDSGSSEADDEGDSIGPVEEINRRRGTRKNSSSQDRLSLSSLAQADTPSTPLPTQVSSSLATADISMPSPPMFGLGITTPGPAFEKSTASLTLRETAQLDLAPFDTIAPVASLPPTPLQPKEPFPGATLCGPVALSESEMSYGGGTERSTLMKTLSGLWAFRTGDFTPLAYPM